MDLEQKLAGGRVEARSVAFTDVDTADDGATFTGYAAVFDHEADLGDFTESISRGAFRKAIAASGNIPMLYDHNPALPVLATTGGGTLKLKEDGRGLRVEANVAKHYMGEAVRELVKRGDIRGMSFGFIAGAGNSKVEQRDGRPHRTLSGFQRLLDVSPTWDPAYTATSAELRSLRALQGATDHTVTESGLTKVEFRALATDQLGTILEGMQSTAEAIEAALSTVGYGDGDDQTVAAGPFTDEQYAAALDGIRSLLGRATSVLYAADDLDWAVDALEVGNTDDIPTGRHQDQGTDGQKPVETPGSEAKASTEEQRSGADTADVDSAARRRLLQMMGFTLPKGL